MRPARTRLALVPGILTLFGCLAAPAAGQEERPRLKAPRKGPWEPIAVLKGPAGQLRQLGFSPDGAMLAAAVGVPYDAGAPPALRLWSLRGDRPTVLYNWKARPQGFVRFAFSPDGKTLTAVGGSGMTKRWDLASGKELAAFVVGKKNGDGVNVARAWFVATGQILAVQPPEIVVGFGDIQPPRVEIWDVAAGKLLKVLQLPYSYSAVGLSPGGKTLVTTAETGGGVPGTGVRFWDVLTGRPATSLRAQQVTGAIFSPNDTSLLIQGLSADSQKPKIGFWDRVARKAQFPRNPALLASYAQGYSGDGKLLVTLSANRNVVSVWDLATEKLVGSVGPLEYRAQLAALSADGRVLAVADENGAVGLWAYKGP